MSAAARKPFWRLRSWRGGIAVSSVSLDHHFRKSKTTYCDFGQSFNCDLVNRSEYSTIAGVPVALLGMMGYIALLAFATFTGKRRRRRDILLFGSVGRPRFRSLSHLRRKIYPLRVVHSVLIVAGDHFFHHGGVRNFIRALDARRCIVSFRKRNS